MIAPTPRSPFEPQAPAPAPKPKKRKKTNPGDQKKAVAYIRVSTDDQHLGPVAQRQAIETWAAREGVEIVHWCEDIGVSGATPLDERPGFVCALSSLEALGAGLLVAHKRDRLARDVVIAAGLQDAVSRQGAQIVTTAEPFFDPSDPVGQLMVGLLDLFAQFERAQIRSRTKLGLQAKKAQGKVAGKAPYGYFADEDGNLHPHHEEQATIQRIRQLKTAGFNQREIVETLATEGRTSRAGTPLRQTQVSRILRNS